MSYDVGDPWGPQLEVRDATDTLTDATTVTLTITSPSGTESTPTVSHDDAGIYSSVVLLDEQGQWTATWTVSGTVTGVEEQFAFVRRPGSNIVSLNDVKQALNKTLRVDDNELERILDEAIAEYEEWVGPVSGTVTEVYDGGRARILLRSPQVTEITAASYTDGTTISVDDLDLDTRTGIVGWGVNTAGVFTWGSRNVSITYKVGPVPANHRGAIIADVAGYFEATQRGPATLPGEGYDAAFRATPVVLFPRIRALAPPSVA